MNKKIIPATQPKLWKELVEVYTSTPEDQRKTQIEAVLMKYDFSQEQASMTVNKVLELLAYQLEQIKTQADLEIDPLNAVLTKQDITYLKDVLSQEESKEVIRLVVTFAIYARKHPHYSNWIRFDKKEVLYVASLQKLSAKDFRAVSTVAHDKYGLSMQVVGSKQPIPCFQLSWQITQQITDENPLIPVTEYTPDGIKSFITQTIQGDKKNV